MINDRADEAPRANIIPPRDETLHPPQAPAYTEQELPDAEQDQNFGPYLKDQIMRRAVPTAF